MHLELLHFSVTCTSKQQRYHIVVERGWLEIGNASKTRKIESICQANQRINQFSIFSTGKEQRDLGLQQSIGRTTNKTRFSTKSGCEMGIKMDTYKKYSGKENSFTGQNKNVRHFIFVS